MKMKISKKLLSGVAGTLAVAALGPLEKKLLRRVPRFAPSELASGLSKKWLGKGLSTGKARELGTVMRALYGPSWALTLGPKLKSLHPAVRIGAMAALIFAFEELALPALGASAPRKSWKPLEHLLLGAQTVAYAATVELAERPQQGAEA